MRRGFCVGQWWHSCVNICTRWTAIIQPVLLMQHAFWCCVHWKWNAFYSGLKKFFIFSFGVVSALKWDMLTKQQYCCHFEKESARMDFGLQPSETLCAVHFLRQIRSKNQVYSPDTKAKHFSTCCRNNSTNPESFFSLSLLSFSPLPGLTLTACWSEPWLGIFANSALRTPLLLPPFCSLSPWFTYTSDTVSGQL